MDTALTPIEIGLTTAIVAVNEDEPVVLVAAGGKSQSPAGLPSGPFDPLAHRTLEIGLRAWVAAQTALTVAYVEQLYTFGDRGRHARAGDTAPHIVSVGYLALTRLPENVDALRKAGADFSPWYRFFPWEDWRTGPPRHPGRGDPAASCAMVARSAQRRLAQGAAAALFRHRGQPLGRGKGAGAL